jgi:hypothetical protein
LQALCESPLIDVLPRNPTDFQILDHLRVAGFVQVEAGLGRTAFARLGVGDWHFGVTSVGLA